MFTNRLISLISRTNKIFLYDLRKCSSIQKDFSTKPDVIPDENDLLEEKLLRVAIIGVPNSGKSTFINHLMDRNVCATSSKVHTTRCKSKAIFTEQNSQIVFVDTPGLVNNKDVKKHQLEKSFINDSLSSLKEADIIGVIHDVSNTYTRERLELRVIKLLEEHIKKPSFLVLNKIDILKSKRKLLDLTRMLTENCLNGKLLPNKKLKLDSTGNRGWPNFNDIFMVSALTGSGLDEVKNYLIAQSKPGKWMFPAEIWSDQTAESIVVNTVKGKLLDFLPQEIPYVLKPQMEFFDINEEGKINTVVLVKCPSNRINRLVAGANDGRLRQIIEAVQKDLQETFHNFVRINIILEGPKVES